MWKLLKQFVWLLAITSQQSAEIGYVDPCFSMDFDFGSLCNESMVDLLMAFGWNWMNLTFKILIKSEGVSGHLLVIETFQAMARVGYKNRI